MSYRIARITSLYNEFLRQYQATFPEIIRSGTFQEKYDHLVQYSFDTTSSISKHFRRIGIEAFDIFTNVTWLQDQWQIENGISKSGKELLYEQLKRFNPGVIWIDDPGLFDADWIEYLRKNIPSLKIVTGLVCAPYSSRNIRGFRALNFLATCTPCLKKEFEANGIETHLIYHAFDPDVFTQNIEENNYPELGLLFTGSLYVGGGFHKTRIEYLEEFLGADLPVKIYGSIDSDSKILSKMTGFYGINFFRLVGAGKLVKHVPFLNRYESFGDTPIKFYSQKLRASVFAPVYGLEQFKLLSKASICFNIHGEIAKGCAGNIRLFEATGMGTCLVTDWKTNLHDLFEPDKEVIAYKSKEECIEKIQWLLKNPAEVRKIAKAGQERTLRDHTIPLRVQQIDNLLRNKM